ncbi:hypothetical protein JW905_04760 [bacterium]|nr:hypothetical protein [candidate division CSSED10-310 bacterium]
MKWSIVYVFILWFILCGGVAAESAADVQFTVEKLWEMEGAFEDAYLEPVTGNVVLYERENPAVRSVRVVRRADGGTIQNIKLLPNPKDSADWIKRQRTGADKDALDVEDSGKASDSAADGFDGMVRFSQDGRYMAKLRWRWNRDGSGYESFLQLFELREDGYEKAWECATHPFWRYECDWNPSWSHTMWSLVKEVDGSQAGPATFSVLPEGQVLFYTIGGPFALCPEMPNVAVFYADGAEQWRFDVQEKYGETPYPSAAGGCLGLLADGSRRVMVFNGVKRNGVVEPHGIVVGVGFDGAIQWEVSYTQLPTDFLPHSIWPSSPVLTVYFQSICDETNPITTKINQSNVACTIDIEGSVTFPFSFEENELPERIQLLSKRYYFMETTRYPQLPVLSPSEVAAMKSDAKLLEAGQQRVDQWFNSSPNPRSSFLYDAERKERFWVNYGESGNYDIQLIDEKSHLIGVVSYENNKYISLSVVANKGKKTPIKTCDISKIKHHGTKSVFTATTMLILIFSKYESGIVEVCDFRLQ